VLAALQQLGLNLNAAASPIRIVGHLPQWFNADTMHGFIQEVMEGYHSKRCGEVVFDFGKLAFIDPVGVVVLANLVEYFKSLAVPVYFEGLMKSRGARFLADAGFFAHYVKAPTFQVPKKNTMPLQLINGTQAASYLRNRLVPWIGEATGLAARSLEALQACLAEVFQNVRDHSGVEVGCTFAQHFPNRQRLQIAVSDFGRGIPALVRRVVPGVMDSRAIYLACQEGFTSKTQVWNGGAGLPNLIRLVTERNGGNVMLAAHHGLVLAAPHGQHTKIETRMIPGWYPGTLVRVILRTDRLPSIAAEVEPEEFTW
jgi:anti-sigma regulatory factor (Ser/Thr protein kinase)